MHNFCLFRIMVLTRRIIFAIFLINWGVSAIQRCPQRCGCGYDPLGRKTVTCDAGRLGSAIPVFDMDRDTKVMNEYNYMLVIYKYHLLYTNDY